MTWLLDKDGPHPDLVAAQQPTPEQVLTAAALLGGFPPGSYLAGDLLLGENVRGTF